MQLSQYDLKRLEYYSRNMADYHLIMDLLPNVTKTYCLGAMGDTHFSAVQLVSSLTILPEITTQFIFGKLFQGYLNRYGIAVQDCR